MSKGAAGCPAGHEVKTEAECVRALVTMGKCHASEWSGTADEVPPFCSHRPDHCGEDDMHFNFADRGAGRADVTPVCRA